MKKDSLSTALIIVMLLPGCGGNLVDWGKKTFVQSKKQKDSSDKIKSYVKQINLYDQLNTVGLFDALWLSDEVRRFYAEKYAAMTGKTEDETMTMLRRLYKANAHAISLYVLTPYDVVFAVKPVEWGVYLEVDDKKYQPVFIKKCELPSQYKALFGTRFNAHKQPYEVKFDRHDANGVDLLSHDVSHMVRFVIASPKYLGSAQWDVPVSSAEDFLITGSDDTDVVGQEVSGTVLPVVIEKEGDL